MSRALTVQEQQVMVALGSGHSTARIAREMGKSQTWVRQILTCLCADFACGSVTELAEFARLVMDPTADALPVVWR